MPVLRFSVVQWPSLLYGRLPCAGPLSEIAAAVRKARRYDHHRRHAAHLVGTVHGGHRKDPASDLCGHGGCRNYDRSQPESLDWEKAEAYGLQHQPPESSINLFPMRCCPFTGPHSRQRREQALDAAWKAGIRNLSIDLMYGLPGQIVDDVRRDVPAVGNSRWITLIYSTSSSKMGRP